MTLENIKLDVDYARSKFPAFKDELSKDWIFCENAGGSYVPENVINRLNKFMTSTKVQPYAEYAMSKIAGENMDKATKLFADIINAKENEILVGGSTSINLYVLSNALKKFINPGDEIIVTELEHHSNYVPWHYLREKKGAVIKFASVNDNGEVDKNEFKKQISDKTKMIAFTHISNVTGTIMPVKEIIDLAKTKNIPVLIDGTQGAPHSEIDMQKIAKHFGIKNNGQKGVPHVPCFTARVMQHT